MKEESLPSFCCDWSGRTVGRLAKLCGSIQPFSHEEKNASFQEL
jgi:hypothetical protein